MTPLEELNDTRTELENCRDELRNTQEKLHDREEETYKLRDERDALRNVLECQKVYKVARAKFESHRGAKGVTINDPVLAAFLKATEDLKAALLTVGENPDF